MKLKSIKLALAATLAVLAMAAAFADKAERKQIDAYMKAFEEAVVAEEKGDALNAFAMMQQLGDVTKLRSTKEWTQADEDKLTALGMRHSQAMLKSASEYMQQQQREMAAEWAQTETKDKKSTKNKKSTTVKNKAERKRIDDYIREYEKAVVMYEKGDKTNAVTKMMELIDSNEGLDCSDEWTDADYEKLMDLGIRYQKAGGNAAEETAVLIKKEMEAPHVSQKFLDAIHFDDAETIKKMVAAGENPNGTRFAEDAPVLWDAVRNNKVKSAKALIECGAKIDYFKYKDTNYTILHAAGNYIGGAEMAKLLLDNGAKQYINAATNNGKTPLMCAAEEGKIEVAKVLLDAGAKINAKDKNGKSVLFYASAPRETRDKLYMNQYPGDMRLNPQIHKKADKEVAEFLAFLIKSGANNKSEYPEAIWMNGLFPTAMKVLIDAGADVNAKVSAGAQPNVSMRPSVGNEPEPLILHFAGGGDLDTGRMFDQYSINLYKEVATLLIDSGAKVNVRRADGTTQLHSAVFCFRGHSDVPQFVKFWIEKGVDIDAKDNDGHTALHEAATCGAANNIKVLLDAGAKVNPENNDGATPLDIVLGNKASFYENYNVKAESLLKAAGGVAKKKHRDSVTGLEIR